MKRLLAALAIVLISATAVAGPFYSGVWHVLGNDCDGPGLCEGDQFNGTWDFSSPGTVDMDGTKFKYFVRSGKAYIPDFGMGAVVSIVSVQGGEAMVLFKTEYWQTLLWLRRNK